MNKYDLIKFTDNNFELDVRADYIEETVWLTQDEIGLLFDVDRTRHINKIYKDKELSRKATCAESAHVQIEGERKVERKIRFYNLDMIISVGYRVRSKRGILFRQRANRVLKDYLTKGYAVNQKRLDALTKTIDIQRSISCHHYSHRGIPS